MDMLQVQKVNKVYSGRKAFRALTDLSLSIREGEFVGIMGPSGSGKTTLLNVISTIDRPSSGQIIINGIHPHKLRSNQLAAFRRKELGFVFQEFHLIDTLTIRENILLPLTLAGVSIKEMEQRLERLAVRLGIQDIQDNRIDEVSRGQQQRTAIARAVIHRPSLLLADEPTGNLDSKASRQVMETFQSINEKERTTMMMVTHDPVAASYCNRVIFIKDGMLYNEIHAGDNRSAFYQKIINALSLLGGDANEFSTIRV
ncbi:bacitracin ABC transporter ATP-binding protein [Paenibacillus selenitireducens]|uniref:Bacitracin ABC transporter ATP-binding protein n=2 Tax=Paenibacillus selenitireducens TaxID=1324314 RepID=A0A1T2XBA3_9BACL|nr:bacitracin ABC transporter ATP-binding protein [Paenibacillus selenitireducens]